MEGNRAMVNLLAILGCAWLLLSLSPLPVRYFGYILFTYWSFLSMEWGPLSQDKFKHRVEEETGRMLANFGVKLRYCSRQWSLSPSTPRTRDR